MEQTAPMWPQWGLTILGITLMVVGFVLSRRSNRRETELRIALAGLVRAVTDEPSGEQTRRVELAVVRAMEALNQ